MLSSTIGRLRLAGMSEAVSFLVLLFIAMPFKYLLGNPILVQFVGWIHGVLFVLYCLTLFLAHREFGWKLTKTAMFFVAAFVPFGPFIADAKLRSEGNEA